MAPSENLRSIQEGEVLECPGVLPWKAWATSRLRASAVHPGLPASEAVLALVAGGAAPSP